MYAYTHDEHTGGLLLNNSTPQFSKEPRPVYYRELDILGFDKHWNYAKQDELPYMWAEANYYWYRGRIVAKTKGGTLYSAPELEFELDKNGERLLPDGETLLPVDIVTMVEKNRQLLEVIEQITIKKIFDVYKRYQKKLNIFHVAFSGGKDSIVLLELVKKALPKSGFVVVFGDTGMEFPDTYHVIDKVEEQCHADQIEFYRACSHIKPEESWRLFGPPSRVQRWCCSVHKSAPQTLKLREVLGKNDYIGMDFVGVRAHESATRADYNYENYGKKQRGQYSHNSLLEWTSAEVWLYIYTHGLVINEAYKKGNSRAGCLFCPMGGGKGDWFQRLCYQKEIDEYIDIIKSVNARDLGNPASLETYITNGGWNARKNGRDLKISTPRYQDEVKDGELLITITNPATDWREWIKTLGEIPFEYKIVKFENRYTISISERLLKEQPVFIKRFKQVFKKAAHCVKCKVCEANCHNGCISFANGLKIEDCLHCGQCHNIDDGCLVYHSLKLPQGGERIMKSINSFANHAPKLGWVKDFFEKKSDYWTNNNLGPNQVPMFKRFLRESGLLKNNEITRTTEVIETIGWESGSAWGIILSNFAYNRQCEWYIKNLEIGRVYTRETVSDMLVAIGVSKNDTTSIINAFKRLCELPLGTKLNFGTVTKKGKQIETLARSKSTLEDNRVVLYALYKFAEACDGYYQFTLTRLLDHTIESLGISPTQIFGFDRDDMERILLGLTAKHPDFINATFTHDLDKISLQEDKTSEDVLTLF
ncbi:phosphoadenosine phosphosulfate reductase domain-containing protein [Desulfotomaculum sp. 1211_IL3151]|uniref:phosphoadenosine phosphosulfate reductase domain-containing protein n=1 Tax=Desulfotomaculum sp. 1211_IL3151 TaxID=3084055 RepID=UPI002FDA44BC